MLKLRLLNVVVATAFVSATIMFTPRASAETCEEACNKERDQCMSHASGAAQHQQCIWQKNACLADCQNQGTVSPAWPALSNTQWKPIGPAPISTPNVGQGLAAGRVEAAAPDPSNADVMFIAADNGGVWRTLNWNNTDGPPTWVPLTDDKPSLDFAGYHPLMVHASTGHPIFAAVCRTGAGILKSTDTGLTWQLVGNSQFEGAAIGSIAVHPGNINVLYVSVWDGGPGGGVYKSTDGGLNWQNTTSFHTGSVSDVVIDPSNPQILYAGLIDPATGGIYKSADGGANWTLLSGMPSAFFLANARLEIARSASNTVYAAVISTDNLGNQKTVRYKTIDGGQNWTQLSAVPGDELRSWHVVLAVDPKDANHIFANSFTDSVGYQLYESTDAGQTWTRAENLGDDWVNMAFDANNNAVVTADRNLYRYAPKEKQWLSRQGNLQITQFYTITPWAQGLNPTYGVAQDQVHAMRFNSQLLWSYVNAGGETGRMLIGPANPIGLFVSNPLDPDNLVRRSDDSGQSWTTILTSADIKKLTGTDIKKDDYHLAYATQKSFVTDFPNMARLLLGTTQVVETKDALVTPPAWAAISPVLSPSSKVSDQYIVALAIAPWNPNTVYAATADGHVWVTYDGGANWKQRDTGLFDAGAGMVLDIRIDIANPKRGFAVTNGPPGMNVWQIRDGEGASDDWINISGDMPMFASSISVGWQYAIPALYVGTNRGVFHSVDRGRHWKKFGQSLPNTVVSDLQPIPNTVPDLQSFAFDQQDNPVVTTLVAGTGGRGAWAILTSASKISGQVFVDQNADGMKSTGEPGLAGVTVYLDTDGSGALDIELSKTTDAVGHYAFDAVAPGIYQLRVIAPPGYLPTTPAYSLTVGGSILTQKNFGLTKLTADLKPSIIWDWIHESNAHFETRMKRLIEQQRDAIATMIARATAGARRAAPQSYLHLSDLNALPGRKQAQAVGAVKEFRAFSRERRP
jgi:photosystem II stability/assembly factor-like uncharacterized protein